MSLKTEARSCVGWSVLCFTRQNKLSEQHQSVIKGSLTDDDHRLEHLAKSSSIHGHPAELISSLENNLLALTCVWVINQRKGKKKLDFMETRYAKI